MLSVRTDRKKEVSTVKHHRIRGLHNAGHLRQTGQDQ